MASKAHKANKTSKPSKRHKPSKACGDRWDVQQYFLQQFKSDYVRQLECLVFKEK
jgi:hypothetical protein